MFGDNWEKIFGKKKKKVSGTKLATNIVGLTVKEAKVEVEKHGFKFVPEQTNCQFITDRVQYVAKAGVITEAFVG